MIAHDDDDNTIVGIAAASAVFVAAMLGIVLASDLDVCRGTFAVLVAVIVARILSPSREARRARDRR